MSTIDKIEPRWVIVAGHLREVSDFARFGPQQRPVAICPLCEQPVVLKLGAIKVHHYAHRRGAACAASLPETALHLNTKFHFYHQLKNAREREVFVEQACECCHQQKRNQVWVRDWEDVQVEYRMDSARPDIALLAQGRVIGALEILVTHAVDERKAAYFAEKAVPWLQIRAAPEVYLEPTAWTTSNPLPLPVEDSPYPPWTCDECNRLEERERSPREHEPYPQLERKQDSIEIIIHAAMMADIYYARGRKYRDAIYVKNRLKDGVWIEAWVENRREEVLFAVKQVKAQPLDNSALHSIRDYTAHYLRSFQRLGHIVDVVADWRTWEHGERFSACDLNRYPLGFSWDQQAQQWVAENRKQVFRQRSGKPKASLTNPSCYPSR